MSTTLGGQTLADPIWGYTGYERAAHDIGAVHEMANGNLVYDYVGYRPSYVLRWIGLTSTQRNTIWNRYVIKAVQAFSPPDDAGSINVLVVPGSWREAYVEIGGSPRYRVEIALEAAAVS
jgi:hypothetical protein